MKAKKKVTKKELKVGMNFLIEEELSCVPLVLDEYGSLNTDIGSWLKIKKGENITVTERCKKYIYGSEAELVKFTINGNGNAEFLQFWQTFKESTNIINNNKDEQ